MYKSGSPIIAINPHVIAIFSIFLFGFSIVTGPASAEAPASLVDPTVPIAREVAVQEAQSTDSAESRNLTQATETSTAFLMGNGALQPTISISMDEAVIETQISGIKNGLGQDVTYSLRNLKYLNQTTTTATLLIRSDEGEEANLEIPIVLNHSVGTPIEDVIGSYITPLHQAQNFFQNNLYETRLTFSQGIVSIEHASGLQQELSLAGITSGFLQVTEKSGEVRLYRFLDINREHILSRTTLIPGEAAREDYQVKFDPAFFGKSQEHSSLLEALVLEADKMLGFYGGSFPANTAVTIEYTGYFALSGFETTLQSEGYQERLGSYRLDKTFEFTLGFFTRESFSENNIVQTEYTLEFLGTPFYVARHVPNAQGIRMQNLITVQYAGAPTYRLVEAMASAEHLFGGPLPAETILEMNASATVFGITLVDSDSRKYTQLEYAFLSPGSEAVLQEIQRTDFAGALLLALEQLRGDLFTDRLTGEDILFGNNQDSTLMNWASLATFEHPVA